MAVLPIRGFGDPVLRQMAREVEAVTGVHRRLVDDMRATMRGASGVGLAAPQVGVLERIFVWEVEDASGALINPVITAHSEEVVADEEGCLSLPGVAYPVERRAGARIEGLDEMGRRVEIESKGLLARVFQHEIDHLDGILFIDRLPPELRREAMAKLTEGVLGPPPGRPAVEPARGDAL